MATNLGDMNIDDADLRRIVRATFPKASESQLGLLEERVRGKLRRDGCHGLWPCEASTLSAWQEREIYTLKDAVRDLLAIINSSAMTGLATFAFVHNYKCCSDEEAERNIATIEKAKRLLDD